MVARIKTVSFQGMKVLPIDVQVQIANGMPTFTIVGLPDKAVGESRERIRAALVAIGLSLPAQRITVNLSPADQMKEGSHYDLPIAIGILCAMGVLPAEELAHYLAMGELSLDSTIIATTGALPTAIFCLEKELGLICPSTCGGEAAWAKGLEILAPKDLLGLINHFRGQQILKSPAPLIEEIQTKPALDLSDIKGQETAKRALIIAATGGHNLLLSGPPGSGKSMLAARLSGILPPLSAQESLDVSMVHSIAGTLPEGRLIRERPYRAPHHTCSQPALVGGGTRAKPGEISLAHHGVLFLDELPEFQRGALESLRQPLEQGEITIARVHSSVTFPAKIQLIGAMNPCRCGYLGDAGRQCGRAPSCSRDYAAKISGPLLDRFDLFHEVRPLKIEQLAQPLATPASATMAKVVLAGRTTQLSRQNCLNAHLSNSQLETHAPLTPEASSLLFQAAEKMAISARSFHRLKKVARTIADLDQSHGIERNHMAEALTFRSYQGSFS